jgi:rhamnosyltransferase
VKNIFIIGSKGIPAKYGGFETFVDELTKRKLSEEITYHISCMGEDNDEFYYNSARCFNVKVPSVGSARAVLYDLLSIQECIRYIKEQNLSNCIVYVLACRIGPFFSKYKRKLEQLGVKVFVNPDGHEWKRSKWNYWIRRYWKLSERLMVKHADLLVCDSKGIETYIQKDYSVYRPKTTFIAYGADVTQSPLSEKDEKLINWFKKHDIQSNGYYLIVGRFVPENNYELMIKEFMASQSNKDLVIISNVEQNDFYDQLQEKTKFDQDSRIKFVGTVYDQDLLKKIRELAYGYLHGHEVGGTNPSLLEALASTKVNLLLEVVFNKEVGSNGAVYFNKEKGNLSSLINNIDQFSEEKIEKFAVQAQKRIIEEYSWKKIVMEYEALFLNT